MSDSENRSEDSSSDNGNTNSENDNDNNEPEDCRTDLELCYNLKFKYIGSKKEYGCQTYSSEYYVGWTCCTSGNIRGPLSPRDSKALAFKCELSGKRHTIGYVVHELLDVVHSVMDTLRVTSVEFAWISYKLLLTRDQDQAILQVSTLRRGENQT